MRTDVDIMQHFVYANAKLKCKITIFPKYPNNKITTASE